MASVRRPPVSRLARPVVRWQPEPVLLEILGPLRVRTERGSQELTGHRPREVLAVLLLRRGTPVTAEVLLDLIGDGTGSSAGVVHTWVARLRRQCGPDVVRRTPGGYLVPSDLRTDADDFTEAVDRARRVAADGSADDVIAALRDALDRWRGGQPYDGVRDDLVAVERARLVEMRTSAGEDLVDALLAAGEPAGLVEAFTGARALVDEHPLRERPHRLLMLAQYRLDRPAEALGTYRDLHRRLRDELGVEPAPATAGLHGAILRHDLPPVVRPAPPAARIDRLPPASLTRLVGRDDDLAVLDAALAVGRRLITLVGPGGVGKSRLLAEIGRRSMRDGSPIVFVDMSATSAAGAAELAETIAVAAGVETGAADPVRGLISGLGEHPRVVLIDEAERVADELAVLTGTLLGGCPAVRVVVSSRRPLDLPGELVHSIAPLPGPAIGADAEQVRAAPAVALLTDRLTERGIAVDGDAAAALLARIARRLDGLPLALELVAGQASGRSLAELADNLDPLDLPIGPLGRHRDLRGVFGSTLDALDAGRRNVFRRLAVFAGPFEIADAQAVLGGRAHGEPVAGRPECDGPGSGEPVRGASAGIGPADVPHAPGVDGVSAGSVADAVRDLARHALLQVDHRPAVVTFRMLTVVRDLARAGLDPVVARELRFRHLVWYADPGPPAGHADPADRVARQVENYSEALRTAIADGEGDAAFTLIGMLAEHWRITGSRLLAVRRLGELLDSGLLERSRRAEILLARARVLQHLDSAAVLRDTAEAMAALGDPAGADAVTLAAVLSVRALESWHLGDAPAAVAAADRAALIAQGLDSTVPAEAAGLRALIHAVAGDPAAWGMVDDARRRVRDETSGSSGLTAAHDVALALTNLGRFDEAGALLAEVWPELPRVDGETVAPHRFLLTRGWVRLGCGDPAAAFADFVAGWDRVGPAAVDRESVEALLGMACTLAERDAPTAADVLAGAGELIRRLGIPMSAQWQAAVTRARDRAGPSSWSVSEVPSDTLVREVARRTGR